MSSEICIAGLIAVCLLTTDPPEAGAQRLIRAKRYSVAQRTEKPTFYANTRQCDMDRGKLVYLGLGMWAEQDTFNLIRRAEASIGDEMGSVLTTRVSESRISVRA